ncbi:helix-turn-helix transcriptional regulator [Agrobacterium genomosp. 3]|uniref:helix-turn-helix domain-containing protein n=1 Tax=Agrobacterium tomkonis TaxID=1183410 RepID=UPI001CD89FE0|nr:helix-turn-helix transcriptional regulator [Agrobacterium tomkonis]MCA1878851.1 helix-turn-helix transcriptional regulator [Agrobacterium tumefaciens]MCA1894067.1 helix-turn-helix transcriptional regulator [Agrobacterium tomkonis]
MPSSISSNQDMAFFRSRQSEIVVAPIFGKSEVTMARISCRQPGHGMIDPHIHEDAFFVAFNLQDYQGNLWVDNRHVDFKTSRAGNFTIYDYRRTWTAEMKSTFDGLGFHIPRSALTLYEEELGGRAIDTFAAKPGQDIEDEVVKGLAQACLPSLSSTTPACRLFQDHVAAVMTFHLCKTYGGLRQSKPIQGYLAPWQKRRAIELLEENLSSDISIEAVAAECGLSRGYFIKAFGLTMGHPPYRWVLLRRIEKAKEMLLGTRFSISEISFLCGFADQAHFTRTFTSRAGIPPAQWRKTIQ